LRLVVEILPEERMANVDAVGPVHPEAELHLAAILGYWDGDHDVAACRNALGDT
jgi:hypothetical protein